MGGITRSQHNAQFIIFPFLSVWKHSAFSLISCYKEFLRYGFSKQPRCTLRFESVPFWSRGCGGFWLQDLISQSCAIVLDLIAYSWAYWLFFLHIWFSGGFFVAHCGVCFLEVLPGLKRKVALDSGLQSLDEHSHSVSSLTCKLCVPFCLWRRVICFTVCLAFWSLRGLQC